MDRDTVAKATGYTLGPQSADVTPDEISGCLQAPTNNSSACVRTTGTVGPSLFSLYWLLKCLPLTLLPAPPSFSLLSGMTGERWARLWSSKVSQNLGPLLPRGPLASRDQSQVRLGVIVASCSFDRIRMEMWTVATSSCDVSPPSPLFLFF